MSFRDATTLSFEATKDSTFEATHVVEVAPGVRLLRLAIVLGANASGKSNMLRALEFLRQFWFEQKREVDEPTGHIPFLLDRDVPQQPGLFELRFWTKGLRYRYHLELTEQSVIDERLYYYKAGSAQPTLVTHRRLDEHGQSVVKFNPAVVKVSAAAQEEIQLKCLRNMSLFAARNQVNIALPVFDDARDWMRTGIIPLIEPDTPMFGYAKQRIKSDVSLRDYILDFVRQADFNIADMQPATRDSHNDEIRFVHRVDNLRGEERYTLPPEMQSLGTQRTLGLETAIYEALKSNALLSVDEFDASLHPDLLEFAIQRFLQSAGQSQLLITTHYDNLLATVDDLIRKDNVRFTEKDPDGSSHLYSLADFKGLGKMTPVSIRNAYRHGQFGAIPNI
jgi:hypothetical protein